jgi:hypothetical protein
MNKQEIESEYNKIVEHYKKPENKIDLTNRLNVYKCSKGHKTVTKDIDPGVTPFMLGCKECEANGEKRSEAYSAGYQIPEHIKKDLTPGWEWYRPSIEDTLKMSPPMIDHIIRGGLDLRKCN